MSSESDGSDDTWHYARGNTLEGALQRGLGRGAVHAGENPALVLDCLRRDCRWDWGVDQRGVYLARLVRDLGLPVEPIAARLFVTDSDDTDHHNEFANTLGVLEVLGRAGDGPARTQIRRYIADGRRWLQALELIAHHWPNGLWDDLDSTAIARLAGEGDDEPFWRGTPWTTWAGRAPRIASGLATTPHRPALSPYTSADTPGLLALLRDPGRAAERGAALRELRRRPPEPALLDFVDDLLSTESGYPLTSIVRRQGRRALPYARIWAAEPDHPLHWTAVCLLAENGERGDVPALLAALDWQDARADDLCGYDTLVTGLARIGGPGAETARRRIRRLWFSPHSYERAGYLRAHLAIDPQDCAKAVFEGLWDCESDVRQIAVQHVPLDDRTHERLRYLRDDPMETSEVRDTAAARLPTR